jgi:putative two-component system response regulator
MTEGLNDPILIVDDEPTNVLLLRRLLGNAGYVNLTTTSDPVEAEDLFAEAKPDLVLMDLHMPMMDGFELMDRITRSLEPDEYLPILVLTADVTPESKRKALAGGASDFLIKPFDAFEVVARVKNLLHTRRLHQQLRRQNDSLEQKVRARTADLWEAIRKVERGEKELRLAQEETIHRLSLAAEFRDDETSRHIERMSRYCSILAGRIGWDEEECELLRIASKMHDVGKIGVPDSILLKPGKLTPEEFDVIKQHSDIGFKILEGSRSELACRAATIAWTHHEKVDGSGYPRGLQGDEIPLEGRLAAIADVFDALTTNRVYRKAFELTEAVKIMQEGRGRHFDPELLDVFFSSLHLVLAQKERFEDRVAS